MSFTATNASQEIDNSFLSDALPNHGALVGEIRDVIGRGPIGHRLYAD